MGGQMVSWAIWGGLAAVIAPYVTPERFWPQASDFRTTTAAINFLWGPMGALLATLLGLVLFFGILPAMLLGMSYGFKKGGKRGWLEAKHVLAHTMRGIGGFIAALILLGLGTQARVGALRINGDQGDKLVELLLAIFLGACGGIILGAVLGMFARRQPS
jgi:hypothetical protein